MHQALMNGWKRDLPEILNGHDPHFFSPHLTGWAPSEMALEGIFQACCDYYLAAPGDVRTEIRSREFVLPRQMYCYLAKIRTGKSLKQIGTVIKRDPTTVLYSYKMIETRLKEAVQSTEMAFRNLQGTLNRRQN
jgi:chromosomal replication initiation ATPase DnaA